MSSSNNSFRDWLCREVRDVLGRNASPPPLLIWCDPDHAWLDLLRVAAEFDGFELWAPAPGEPDPHELLLRDRFFTEPRAARVVWLPCARDEISWFKPFELEADEVWEKRLVQGLREYGVEIPREHEDDLAGLLPAQALEWFDKPRATWIELTPNTAKDTLFGDDRMLLALAGPPGEFDRVKREGKFEFFARRATQTFGLPNPQGMDEAAWRVAATACFLCTDAAEGSPQDPPREPDKIIPSGLPRTQAMKLLQHWQHDTRYVASYESLSRLADTLTGLAHWARSLSTLPRSRSSRAAEEALFNAAVDRLDKVDDVDGLCRELERNGSAFEFRAEGFWGKHAAEPVGWKHLVDLTRVAALLVEHHAAESVWKKLPDAVGWYAERGWQLDAAGEDLFRESADLPPNLQRIRARLRRGCLRTLDRIGRAYSELLAKSSGRGVELPTAGEVVLSVLEEPSLPTALVFLDACRYELGRRLAAMLNQGEPAHRATVLTAVSPVPSVTALGMPFALPMKRDKLHVDLAADGKTFEVTAEGFSGDLKIAEQRRKWLKENYDVKDWLTMAEVLDGDGLKKPGRGRKMVAVHAAEFDDHDGHLQLTGAGDHLRRYVKAIHRLRDAGYSRVIVATDHGFFHWQPGDHEIEDAQPSGKVLWKHRRAMVGHSLSHPSAVHLTVPQSSLEVVVPRSTNAFRTYGALGFFHGGATLQEMIIPVVVATWPAKARKVAVVLKPVGPITGEAPRVQVQAVSTGQLFANGNLMSRRVMVKICEAATGKEVFRHSEPATIEPEVSKAETVVLSLVSPKPELPRGTPLVVEVTDADDKEPLVREEVMLMTDLVDF